MGCYHSLCADSHRQRPAPENGMHGVLLGELGRWKASLDILVSTYRGIQLLRATLKRHSGAEQLQIIATSNRKVRW